MNIYYAAVAANAFANLQKKKIYIYILSDWFPCLFAVQIPARILKNDAGYKNHGSVIFLS